MEGKMINYYIDGNTAKGFYSLAESNVEGMEYLFQIHGAPGTGKSALITRIAGEWLNKGFDIELMHCSSGYINGVIIPKLKLGILASPETGNLASIISGKIIQIDLNAAIDPEKLSEHRNKIIELESRIKQMLEAAYEAYSQALTVHDEWEKIYISNMNFNKADAIAKSLIETIFKNKSISKEPVVRHRFLGAATPEGPKDFVDNLTAGVNKRYFIKGRPGSGKSTLLKKLISNARQRGFDTEVYHCGLDPDSLDMVIIRELGVCVFDSTPPHEYFPERENDETIDMYALTIRLGTDEKHRSELADIISRYKSKISEGTSFLAQGKKYSNELEEIYSSVTNIHYVDKACHDISSKIGSLGEQ